MHINAEHANTILMNILNDLPEEKLLEEEKISIAEPKLLPKTYQPLAIVEPELPQKEEEEFPLPNFLFDIEDDLFTDFGNTLNYHLIKKPQQHRNFATIDSTHSDKVDFLKKATKELISVLSDEWLEESEFLNKIIRINSLSITIQCQLDKYPFETLYNLVVGVNIMSATFAEYLFKDIPFAPTNKLLKSFRTYYFKFRNYVCPFYLCE
jgi:hypothetical protein